LKWSSKRSPPSVALMKAKEMPLALAAGQSTDVWYLETSVP
jgi:hypothetical protein